MKDLDFKETELLGFSKIESDGKKILIQVVRIESDAVFYHVVDEITDSPFNLFSLHSFDVLKQRAALPHPLQISYDRLLVPFASLEQHLCVGLNYKDHVQESGQNELVLFPKLGRIISYNSIIPAPVYPELLDYEIELGVIFDRNITGLGEIQETRAGFFIANDFSDRAPQIYFYGDEKNHPSFSFAAAKSKRNYSLISPLLVVPRDWRVFAKNLEMKLWVNGVLKQSASTANMTQTIEDMLLRALKTSPSMKWPLLKSEQNSFELGSEVTLLPVDSAGKSFIPKNMIFMTGTPGGTIFQKPRLDDLAKAFLAAISKKSTPSLSFKKKLKLALIENFYASKAFLQPGDRVESQIDFLGTLNFSITKATSNFTSKS